MSNQKNNRYVNKPENSQSPKTTKPLSEDEQLLLYADIISNFLIKEIFKDEKRKHHSC
jgi:hypothetical protein